MYNTMTSSQTEDPLDAVASAASGDAKPKLRSYFVVLAIDCVYFAQLMAIVSSGFLAQSIASHFAGSTKVVWLGSIINITTMALAPPFAQAADLVGRRWFLLVSTIFGATGCIIVSRAQNMATVIAGYTVLSVTYGAQSLLLAVVSEVLPRKHRPIAQAVANVAAGLGAIVGLCLGAALIQDGNLENYRICFYINAAVFAAAAVVSFWLYNPPPRKAARGLTRDEKAKRLDWVGYAILPIGLALFSVGLSWADNPYPWSEAHVLAPLLLGAALIALFVLYETRFQKEGMLHQALFHNRNFGLVLAAIGIEGFVFFSCNNYFPFQVSVVAPANMLVVALHWVLMFAVSLPAAMAISAYGSYKKIVRLPMVAGFIAFLIFCILMATSSQNTPKTAFWGFPVILGTGFAAVLPFLFSAAQFSTPAEHIGLASGLMVASRGVGGAVALAINNAIFNSAMSKVGSKIAAVALPLGLPPSSLPDLISALTNHDTAALHGIEGATDEIMAAAGSALLGVFELGFRNVWICAACLTFVGLIAVSFTTDPSAEFTGQVDAPAEAPREGLVDLGEDGVKNGERSTRDKSDEHWEHREERARMGL